MGAPRPVLAVTGLQAEAKIARGEGIIALAGGGDAAGLALRLEASLAAGARAVISFGIAGGLAPGLPPGTVVIADVVENGETRWPTNVWWRSRILDALPKARQGALVGVDAAVTGPAGKAKLYAGFGALAVDMESHVAARLAARYELPFAALRVIADPAERALPQAALVGMRLDGTTDVLAVIKMLARRPGEFPALLRTAFDARAAFKALRHSRGQLCGGLGLDDIADFVRDEAVTGATLVLADNAANRR